MEHTKPSKLVLMAVASFLVMYALMYMMVDKLDNIYLNLDQFYMVVAMTAAMLLIEIFIMGSMYNKNVKNTTVILSTVLLILSFIFVRYQTAISDKDFLKSMIPHHASALLMCSEANLKDTEIKSLCESIISSQQKEIYWMKNKLSNLK